MEKARAMYLGQPYRAGLELRQAKRAFGRAIVNMEGDAILDSLKEETSDPNQSLREDLFQIFGRYLQQVSLNEYEFVALTNILGLLGYSDKEVDAVFQFLIGLNEEDHMFISHVIMNILTSNIKGAPMQDYQGFVREFLSTKEEKLAVLEYIQEGKTKNLKKFIERDAIEIIYIYIQDEVLRERLIVLLQTMTME